MSPELLQLLSRFDKVDHNYFIKVMTGGVSFYIYFVFHNRVLFERLFLKKKYLVYALTVLTTFVIYREVLSYGIWLTIRPPSETVYVIEEIKNHEYLFFALLYWTDFVYMYISLGVYLAFKYARERTYILQVDNARKELELKRLNEQLNPHFLFNALNNIYSYQIRESDHGKELVLKLSELMRYILDNSKKDKVSLDEELKFIENYIAFEKERVHKRCDIHYSKEIVATDFNVVPLIFFNFIENAFKHGTTSIQRSEVMIRIYADDDVLRLFVTNTVVNGQVQSTQTGIDNARQRLNLLYPGKHSLNITHTDDRYTVSLSINNIS